MGRKRTTGSSKNVPKPVRAPAEEIAIAKLKALELLAEGLSDAEVARRVNRPVTNVWNWRTHDPRFVAALAEVRRTGLERAACMLDRNATPAVEVGVAIMRDEDAPVAMRLKAAELVLDRCGLHAKWRVNEAPNAASVQDIRDALREIARQHPEMLAEVVAEAKEG